MSSFHALPVSSAPQPPQRGSFPLDHDGGRRGVAADAPDARAGPAPGECKDDMRRFLECARAHKFFHEPCAPLSRAYLQCRMDRCAPRAAPPPARAPA